MGIIVMPLQRSNFFVLYKRLRSLLLSESKVSTLDKTQRLTYGNLFSTEFEAEKCTKCFETK